jgi:hypothetical protein
MSTFDDIADDEPPLDVPMPRVNLSQQRFSMVSLNSLFRTSLLRTSTLMLTDPRCLDTMLALLQKATLELDCRMTFLLLPKENVQVVLDATQGVSYIKPPISSDIDASIGSRPSPSGPQVPPQRPLPSHQARIHEQSSSLVLHFAPCGAWTQCFIVLHWSRL